MKENDIEVNCCDTANSTEKKIYTRPCAKSKKSPRKKLLWTFVLIAIIAVTIWSITSQDDFSFEEFKSSILSANPWWLVAAACSMILYILAECFAIRAMIRAFKYKQPLGNCIVYSASDIYFSAITPSATGGQPACAYLMMKDGLPGSFSAVSLLIYVIAYNVSIVVMGLITFLIDPSIVFGFSTTSQILIAVGMFCLSSLAVFVLIALFKGSLLQKICNLFVTIFAKLRIIKKPEKWKSRIACSIASYSDCVTHLKGKRNMVIKVFLWSALQRASSILVTVFVCLALGEGEVSAFNAWSAQCMVILGTNMLPVPGGSLFFEALLKDAFVSFGLSGTKSASLSLLSRSISFYLCVVLCGVTLIVKALVTRHNKKKREKLERIEAESQSDSLQQNEIN